MYSDKVTKSVADAVKTVTEQVKPEMLNEELKGNQHKIDANKNNKIDAHDFKLLRSKKQVDEAKYEPAEPDADAIAKKKAREEAQRRREEKAERDADDLSKDYKPKTQSSGVKKVSGRAYGGAAQKDETNESVKSFSGLLESFMTGGIKSLFENLEVVEEEASEEEFNAELKKQKDKAEGKAPQADVAAAATQGTKDMKEEVEELDETPKVDRGLSGKQKVSARAARGDNDMGLGIGNTSGGQARHREFQNVNVAKSGERKGMITKAAITKTKDEIKSRLNKEEVEDLEERTLTSTETAEKERIVKGMKKGIEGFKQRYGERAKEVMYATATARAKED